MKKHTFHIPVMGIGYTIDSPLKVAAFGIDSVISLVDDILLEKLRKYYSQLNNLSFTEITDKAEDFRAERITSYLNLMHDLIQDKIEKLKNTATLNCHLLADYIKHLPANSELKEKLTQSKSVEEIQSLIKENLVAGTIDVNIMTKVDKANFIDHEQLPVEYNDAHAALRGFANSKIASSIVFSAGMNPRLYNYIENFEDFYPDANGDIKKKIILKVSDYRSAIIQGKYLAKKGMWVTEYRIESGLNCGGHAFATDGHLIGPVLEEFKENKQDLYDTTYELFVKALASKERVISENKPALRITAQGGVGTAEEHEFLLKHYELDSIGWGTPFLLVPEATTVDDNTMQQLSDAKEKDLYLSNISPLGIPFNNLRGNSKDIKKANNIEKNRPGSACPKRHVALNQEFKEEGLCIASREYQYLKIKELQEDDALAGEELDTQIANVTEKSCICVGLGTAALLKYNIDHKTEGTGTSVCPGPNMAYFENKVSLATMIDHIYGKTNIINRTDRPSLFVKELEMYVEHLSGQFAEVKEEFTRQQKKSLTRFTSNLLAGISYYQNLFQTNVDNLKEQSQQTLESLSNNYDKVLKLQGRLQQTELATA